MRHSSWRITSFAEFMAHSRKAHATFLSHRATNNGWQSADSIWEFAVGLTDRWMDDIQEAALATVYFLIPVMGRAVDD